MKKRLDVPSKQTLSSSSALGKIFRLGKNDLAPAEGGQSLRALVVDDHRASAEGLRDFLQEWGHEARSAGSVGEAVSVMQDWRPDAVVCDLLMPPGPGGLELLRDGGDSHRPLIVHEPRHEI